jgi:anti-sigma factor (TIGR02949 family)
VSAPTQLRLESLGLPASCVEVLRHLWEYLDAEMTPVGAERLREHISGCAQCREYEGYQSCFLEAMARLKADLDAPSELRDKIAERLRKEGCGCWSKARKSE